MKAFAQKHIIQEVAHYCRLRDQADSRKDLIPRQYYNGLLNGIWVGVLYASDLQPKWLLDWLIAMWLPLGPRERSFGAKEFGLP